LSSLRVWDDQAGPTRSTSMFSHSGEPQAKWLFLTQWRKGATGDHAS